MKIFNRKKKQESLVSLINRFCKLPFIPFDDSIIKSDVVRVCIDYIASSCAKLKGRHIITDSDSVKNENKSDIALLMTPFQFMYKSIQ